MVCSADAVPIFAATLSAAAVPAAVAAAVLFVEQCLEGAWRSGDNLRSERILRPQRREERMGEHARKERKGVFVGAPRPHRHEEA